MLYGRSTRQVAIQQRAITGAELRIDDPAEQTGPARGRHRMRHYRTWSHWAACAGCCVAVAAGAGSKLLAQNPTPSSWVDLPRVDLGVDITTRRNAIAKDLKILDVLVTGNRLRAFYTTEGSIDPDFSILYPGRLRPIDVLTPVPDLTVSSASFLVQDDVPGWNLPAVSGWGDVEPTWGKGGSIVGMSTINGSLLVAGSHRNRNEVDVGDSPKLDSWNGLSFIDDATVRPMDMTIQESWSAGPDLGTGGTGAFRATPEGSTVAYNGSGARFFVQSNYCGDDWAGHLLVVVLPNLSSVNFQDRVVVPIYEFLGDWNDGLPPLSAPPPPGLFGAEVARDNYTCASTPTGPDCTTLITPGCAVMDNVSGNKMRPTLYVHVSEAAPVNAGKDFLVMGLNTDPIDIDTYESEHVKLDGDCGRDDGKYDYLAFIDITDMQAALTVPPTPGSWQIEDLAAWQAHTTFVRLPPDVPPGWFLGAPNNPPLEPGHDWSFVTVLDPTGVDPPSEQRIAGSGTPKSIALHPNGEYVYLIASDQGQESVQENATLTDGGWHVPHLYVVDLFLHDLTNQDHLNYYPPVTQVHRFNKLVSATFGAEDDITGSTLVNSTMGMPTTDPFGQTGLTVVGGAALTIAGPYYPGEFQTDPTARTRSLTLRNLAFQPATRDRLYVGTTGRFQSTDPSPEPPPRTIGAAHVFALAADGTPAWLDTLTVTQEPQPGGAGYYQISGLDVVPTAWVDSPAARNIVAATTINTKLSINSQDRLVLLQDETP
jgi:hypothetical protein